MSHTHTLTHTYLFTYEPTFMVPSASLSLLLFESFHFASVSFFFFFLSVFFVLLNLFFDFVSFLSLSVLFHSVFYSGRFALSLSFSFRFSSFLFVLFMSSSRSLHVASLHFVSIRFVSFFALRFERSRSVSSPLVPRFRCYFSFSVIFMSLFRFVPFLFSYFECYPFVSFLLFSKSNLFFESLRIISFLYFRFVSSPIWSLRLFRTVSFRFASFRFCFTSFLSLPLCYVDTAYNV